MTCRIVTEGAVDEIILRALLSQHVAQDSFSTIVAGGFSPAVSLARTLLLKGHSGITLVVDSDAVVEAEVERRVRLVERLLSPFDSSSYRTFTAIPCIEAWLFLDAPTASSLVGKFAPASLLERTMRRPKDVLKVILRRRYKSDDLTALQRLLNEVDVSANAKHQPLRDLIAYIRSTSHGTQRLPRASSG